jgi:hypothetical protein
MRDWLKRNMRVRQVFIDMILPAVFIGGYFTVKEIGRAYGWWPDSPWGSLAIAVVVGAALGLLMRLLRHPR